MNYEDFDGPSKTERKKQANKAQDLGERLLTMPEDFIDSLGLSERLQDAIALAKTIRQHGGKRRQIQLVGKLMRREDLEKIEKALAEAHMQSTLARDAQHRAERLRDMLLNPTQRSTALSAIPAAEHVAISHCLETLARYTPNTPAYKKEYRQLYRLVLGALA